MRALFLACVLALLASVPGGNSVALASPKHDANDEQSVVAKAQVALERLGLYHGTTNGTLGPQTREALSLYQRKLGLPVTAQIDGRTAVALANPELVNICVARNLPIAECLDAIVEFQARMVEPASGSSDLVDETCRGSPIRSECANAVAAMDKWLSTQGKP
jgi:peptidoglycan hydrolase-like protein with peptidoglycan-binding domain